MDQPTSQNESTANTPPTWPGHARPRATTRVWAAFWLLFSGGLLGIAATLNPDPRGHGTHEQLGWGKFRLAPCGMVISTGYPCPTCGMTTAFAYTMRGNWVRAVAAQPSGFLLALICGVVAVASTWTLVTGKNPLYWLIFEITPYRLFAALVILLFGGWFYKIGLTYVEREQALRGAALTTLPSNN